MQSKWFLALPLTVLAAGACLTTTAMASQTSAPVAAAARPSALPPGYQLVTLPNANVPNFQRRTLYCPGSKKVLGGGAEARGNRAILVGSFPPMTATAGSPSAARTATATSASASSPSAPTDLRLTRPRSPSGRGRPMPGVAFPTDHACRA